MVVGGGNTPSGDITIDDVVKFIHNAIENVVPGAFPYTTWNDIPDYDDANNGDYCKTNNITNQMSFGRTLLNIQNYAIIQKKETLLTQ